MTEQARRKPTQTDIAKAIKAAQSNGLLINRVEIDGAKIIILTGPPDQAPATSSVVSEWRERKNARAAQGR